MRHRSNYQCFLGSPAKEAPTAIYLFRGGRDELLHQLLNGEAPDEFLYGLPAFHEAGFRFDVCEGRPGKFWFKPLLAPIEHVVTKLTGLGFPLTFALADLAILKSANLLVATTDGTALAPLLFKRLGLIKGQVIVISQGLYRVAEALRKQPLGGLRLRLLSWLFRNAEPVVVFGSGDEAAFNTVFSGLNPHPPPKVVQFGIDENFWAPRAATDDPPNGSGPDVLSVGSDILRDYPTLLHAIGNRSCRIVTRLSLSQNLIPANTQVDGNVSWVELRELYRNCRIVVTPVQNKPRDSGHSATLQAMACGKAVILSETAGIWDRERLRHGENIWLVPPDDPQTLTTAISHLLARPGLCAEIGTRARHYVLAGHTSRDFGRHLVELSKTPASHP